MSGITASTRFNDAPSRMTSVLARILEASYPLPDMRTYAARFPSKVIAMGGTFPRHFQRTALAAKRNGKTLLFYGELYNDLGGRTEAEFALNLIEEKGYASIIDLNGPFAAFVWDGWKEELVIVTDRLGRFPVFYLSAKGTTVFTTDLDAVFNAGVLTPELDEESVVDFLTIGFPLGERSMFAGVKRMTGGEVWRLSKSGMQKHSYWSHVSRNAPVVMDELLETFELCVSRATRRTDHSAITLSGGWDSRATGSVASNLGVPVSAATFGVPGSTDVSIASSVAHTLKMQHDILSPGPEFFRSFQNWADKVIILSSGHASIDLAFHLSMYERMAKVYSAVTDSAGCEFHRGIRARQSARAATSAIDVSRFLTTMYATGVWKQATVGHDFFHKHASRTEDKLTQWLDSSSPGSSVEKIDAFSAKELWAHHYAHGYPLQTSLIACQMPFSDNEFYDLYLHSSENIRWTHAFHAAVIHQYAPRLEHIPISHGHVKVPYGDAVTRYIPVVYHRLISRAAAVNHFSSLRRFDNYHPFTPYHQWYGNELAPYVQDVLRSSTLSTSGYLNVDGILNICNVQKRTHQDLAHPITIALTLAHLLEYVKRLRNNTKGKG